MGSFEDERREQVDLVSLQMLKYRGLAEKMNGAVQEILLLLCLESIDEIMLYVARNLKHHLQAGRVLLWIKDAVNKKYSILLVSEQPTPSKQDC